MTSRPTLTLGGLAVDDRGVVVFHNDLDLRESRRFYLVSDHSAGLVRAWHGHRREAKYVTVVSGAAIVAAVAIDDWDHPSKDAEVHRFVLSAQRPAVLAIPPGYANGFKTLRPETQLLFFSTSSIAESETDDHRYDPRYWDPWDVVER